MNENNTSMSSRESRRWRAGGQSWSSRRWILAACIVIIVAAIAGRAIIRHNDYSLMQAFLYEEQVYRDFTTINLLNCPNEVEFISAMTGTLSSRNRLRAYELKPHARPRALTAPALVPRGKSNSAVRLLVESRSLSEISLLWSQDGINWFHAPITIDEKAVTKDSYNGLGSVSVNWTEHGPIAKLSDTECEELDLRTDSK